MQRSTWASIPAIAFAVLLLGCTDPPTTAGVSGSVESAAAQPSKKLVGEWEMDKDATLERAESDAQTEQQKQELAFAKAMFEAMVMTTHFTADGKMTANMSLGGQQSPPKNGVWEVKSEAPLVIVTTVGDETEEIPVTFQDDDTILLEKQNDDGMGVVVMNRTSE